MFTELQEHNSKSGHRSHANRGPPIDIENDTREFIQHEQTNKPQFVVVIYFYLYFCTAFYIRFIIFGSLKTFSNNTDFVNMYFRRIHRSL